MTSTPASFDSTNVHGDILPGLPKRVQPYVLFQIDDNVVAFRERLKLLVPLITTTMQVQDHRTKIAAYRKAAGELGILPALLPVLGINIAFSHSGLLEINDDIKNATFTGGQLADSQGFGDPSAPRNNDVFTPGWINAFKNPVIIISGDRDLTVETTHNVVSSLSKIGFRNTLHEVLTLKGVVHPGDRKEPIVPGFDPIIGQNGVDGVRARSMTGVHPNDTSVSFTLPTDWIVPKGGEYFFSPSIAALRSTFVLP